MLTVKIKTDMDDAVDELIENLVKNKKQIKMKLLRLAQNPKYRLDITKETLALELDIFISKTAK